MSQLRVLPGETLLLFAPYIICLTHYVLRLLGSPRREHPTKLSTLLDVDITPKASARFPENTLASFEAAIRDGAEGIESGISLVLAHPPLRP
jgi:hypothetical protein